MTGGDGLAAFETRLLDDLLRFQQPLATPSRGSGAQARAHVLGSAALRSRARARAPSP